MKILQFFINSNLLISLGAMLWTFAAQIQLGIEPAPHPYLFLIFFATLFEYNLHRLITIWNSPEALESQKHNWVKKNKTWFYILVFISVLGFSIAVLCAKLKVLLSLAPLAALTLFYSTPFGKKGEQLFRLRQIPYLKVFLISLVWAMVTTLLPQIESDIPFDLTNISLIIAERFFFILAITIPFDIRDMSTDKESQLRTIPLKYGKEAAWKIAKTALVLFFLISLTHCTLMSHWYLLVAFSISFFSTWPLLNNKKVQQSPYYHYGYLDGTIIFQSFLILLSSLLQFVQ